MQTPDAVVSYYANFNTEPELLIAWATYFTCSIKHTACIADKDVQDK